MLALVECAPRGPTLAALRLTPALGLHRLTAGGMQSGTVLQTGSGPLATSSRTSAMLPLSVRLRVTSPALDYRGSGFRTLGRSVGGVSLGRAGRSARHHRSGRVRPRNWRAGLAACPHRPVRATNRGNSIRGHRVDRTDPGQGDGLDCGDLDVMPPRAGGQMSANPVAEPWRQERRRKR